MLGLFCSWIYMLKLIGIAVIFVQTNKSNPWQSGFGHSPTALTIYPILFYREFLALSVLTISKTIFTTSNTKTIPKKVSIFYCLVNWGKPSFLVDAEK